MQKDGAGDTADAALLVVELQELLGHLQEELALQLEHGEHLLELRAVMFHLSHPSAPSWIDFG